MFVAHYIPFRAIRAGKQLSDSKGASAAISTEAALLCIKRAMKGFIGPKDIFRNPEAIFRLNEKTDGDSPFDIVVAEGGDDFSVMVIFINFRECILNQVYMNIKAQGHQKD